MSCDGGHLGFPIGIKNINLVKDIPMIIHLQFGFSQFISFREEYLWNFGQSEHIIGLGSHIEYPTGTKNSNFVEDHPRNIPAKFGSNRPSGFGEEDLWNFSQSEHIIGPGSHIEYPTGTKNSNFVEDHPRNILAKFGSNRPSGFGEEAWNVKSLQTTDDRRRTPSDGNSSPGPLVQVN